MHYLAACLLFKDSASYLAEWLEFHLLAGVEHFYLYDNDSADNYPAVLAPFLARGCVTLRRWPGAMQQDKMLQHCLDEQRGRTRWLAFLDDDEFLFPTRASDLPTALEDFERHAGVAISWLLFGSSGHRVRPPGLVTQNYRRRAAWIDPHVNAWSIRRVC